MGVVVVVVGRVFLLAGGSASEGGVAVVVGVATGVCCGVIVGGSAVVLGLLLSEAAGGGTSISHVLRNCMATCRWVRRHPSNSNRRLLCMNSSMKANSEAKLDTLLCVITKLSTGSNSSAPLFC